MIYAFFVGININKYILVKYSTIILLISWIIGTYFISIFISSEVTAKLSLKIPNKQIDSLQELLESKLKLVVPQHIKLDYKDYDLMIKLFTKANDYKINLNFYDLFRNKKYVIDLSNGENSIFLPTIPMKQILIKYINYFKPNTKFRFISERFTNQMITTFAINLKLNKLFRDKINFR